MSEFASHPLNIRPAVFGVYLSSSSSSTSSSSMIASSNSAGPLRALSSWVSEFSLEKLSARLSIPSGVALASATAFALAPRTAFGRSSNPSTPSSSSETPVQKAKAHEYRRKLVFKLK